MSDVNTSVLKSRVIELVDEHAKLAQVDQRQSVLVR